MLHYSNASSYRFLNVLRLSKAKIRPSPRWNAYHSAITKLTTIDAKGTPTSHETGITRVDFHQSYIYIKPEVGNVINSVIVRQLGSNVTEPETLLLSFHHKSLHFAHCKTRQDR